MIRRIAKLANNLAGIDILHIAEVLARRLATSILAHCENVAATTRIAKMNNDLYQKSIRI